MSRNPIKFWSQVEDVDVGDIKIKSGELNLLAKFRFNFFNILDFGLIFQNVSLVDMNLNNVTFQRFVHFFLTRFIFKPCLKCVSKFNLKSNLDVHIKAKHYD